MIYKEISFPAALQMIAEDNLKNLFFESDTGLRKATESMFSLQTLKKYKWFKKIPKETELAKEE
ncbi:hypothetical protein [Planococcus sp. YIM B11945]|uniref:hypothetical protein n=1 Tax=Planococcus sp. YIM B11945 TaxID=3435410 RepID=UPI003D7CCF59